MSAKAMVAAAVVQLAVAGNMNGDYLVSDGKNVGVKWNSDYASKGHEYFDVWSNEIATHYGESFWTSLGNQPLPPAIVERFKNKVMAITGYEQDQVMVVPTGKPGENPDQDVSVPINWAYNHHYMAWMNGAQSEMREVDASNSMYMNTEAHGAATKQVPFEIEVPGMPRKFADVAPSSQMFSEGNGGESRKSFHGYPAGFAQLIESPTTWTITPMQIDTRNRECGATYKDVGNCTAFKTGIEPRSARYGRNWQGVDKPALASNYSGLLECPCTSRFGGDPSIYGADTPTKLLTRNYGALSNGTCAVGESIADAATCFDVVAKSLGMSASTFVNKTVADASQPAGCSLFRKDDVVTATYNTVNSTGCTVATSYLGEATTQVKVDVQVELTPSGSDGEVMVRGNKGSWCGNNRQNVLQSYQADSSSLTEEAAALAKCEAYCLSTAKCTVCSVDQLNKTTNAFSALSSCGHVNSWSGALTDDISRKSKKEKGTATITLTGPADVWYGVGLDAKIMADKPYALIVNSNGVTERQLGTCGSEADHCPGDELASSITMVSNTVQNNRRTVKFTRPFVGQTSKHFTFSPLSRPTFNFIAAIGSSQQFGYHQNHDQSMLTLAGVDVPTCVCFHGSEGQLCKADGKNCNSFVKSCVSSTQGGDLLAQHNPTCNSAQYSGGLKCCSHGTILLDADQEVPPELLRYHMKFRFWFQEYVPANSPHPPQGTTSNATASHFDLPRIYFMTEANAGEYDILPSMATKEFPTIPGMPKYPLNTLTPGTTCTGSCPDGDDCECIQTITYNHTVSNMRLIYAGGHCHAPACVGIWLYRNDPGHEMELLCHQAPVYGQGKHGDKWDEAGYITLPPCLWGDDEGLQPSVLLPPNTELVSIKKNINTKMGHYGEMASWQMRGVSF